MLNITYLRGLCKKATKGPWEAILWPSGEWEMRAKDGPFSTAFGNICSTPALTKPDREEESFANASLFHATREALPELLDRVEALEWLLEVKEVTWADMDAMSMEGFREFREIRKKALRDAGEE